MDSEFAKAYDLGRLAVAEVALSLAVSPHVQALSAVDALMMLAKAVTNEVEKGKQGTEGEEPCVTTKTTA